MKKIIICALFFVMSTSAQAEWTKKIIMIGAHKVEVEIADTDAKREKGLMYRQSLKEGEGMLFVFDHERTLAFWMKNTFIPLSIGYFDKEKVLVDIQDMKPVESEIVMNPPSYPSAKPAQYALEVPQGWFVRKKIKVGAKLQISTH